MKGFYKKIVRFYATNPLLTILVIGFLIRMVAVVFSKGYAMMDDHYLIIEQSQQWVDNYDENKWLPQYGATTPSGHSLFYVGIHYIILLILKYIGIYDAQVKMFIIRFIHALWSLMIVYFGYKIVERLSDSYKAKIAGWLLALLWLFPFLSVRQLVEYACIPFIFWSLWLIISEDKFHFKTFLISGFIGALGVSVRFQISLILVGIVIALLIKKEYKAAVSYSLGTIISFCLVQGLVDFIIWKRPFAEFLEYAKYNIENRYNYFRGNWYNYILLVLGLLLPPVSFMLSWGIVKSFKSYLLFSLPIVIFMLFHMYFPNRQERFILPILPLIIVQGVMGWFDFIEKSEYWKKHTKLHINLWKVFIILNIILLIPLTLTYTKRSYVEAMTYLKNKPLTNFVIDDKNHESNPIVPRFYLQKWIKYYYVSELHPVKKLEKIKNYLVEHNKPLPNYILFFEEENLSQRVDSIKTVFPDIVLDTIVYPGFVDRVMHFLNKRNKNQTIVIYRREYENRH